MVKVITLQENFPYPNNDLPVLLYPTILQELLGAHFSDQDVLAYLEQHNYSNGWTGGIHPFHHFHATVHEVTACVSGEAKIQLGGPDAEVLSFSKGDVALLPAGTAHKKIEATNDFQIVGAYPNGEDFDMEKGDEDRFEELKNVSKQVQVPTFDPIHGKNGAVQKYWK